MRLPELLGVAYRLFPPFVGLVSWKHKVPASALYHSLSVAAIAGGVAELLTDDQDEVDLATYGGLVHDYYQKLADTLNMQSYGTRMGAYGKEDAHKILEEALKDELDNGLVKEILRLTNVNAAERPDSFAWSYPVATLAIWLADTVASTDSAFFIQGEVYGDVYKLREPQLKLLDELSLDVVSVSIPQVALRSLMYAKLYEQVKDRAVPVLARDGLVIIRRSDEQVKLSIDIDEFRATDREITLVKGKVCSKRRARGGSEGKSKKKKKSPEEKFMKMYKPEVVTKGSGVEVELDESVRNALVNVELTGVKYTRENPYRCLLCGYPVPNPLHPGWYGYTVYGRSTGLERWSPRVPPHVNLNIAFSDDNWLKNNLVLCPLCVLDAFAYREVVGEGGFAFVIQFFFPLPTHYEVAKHLATVALALIDRAYVERWDFYRELLSVVEQSFANHKPLLDVVLRAMGDSEEISAIIGQPVKDVSTLVKPVLVDATWATVVLPVKQVFTSKDRVEYNKELAFWLPSIALTSFITGLYPASISPDVEPCPERRLISPVKPLYDFSPHATDTKTHTPLVLLTLAVLSTMADEEAEPGALVEPNDRLVTILDYLDYPFTMYENVLPNHRVGRKGLDAYRSLRSDPVGYFTQYIRA